MERIKAISYGLGEMGKLITRLAVEKGVLVVGAIGHVSNIGQDVGEVVGLGYPLNVKVSNDADMVLREQEADIALVALFTEMERMYPHLAKCIENGLNVITTSEEALYPWPTSPELVAKLDKLAQKHGVTITGSGSDDIFGVNLLSMLTGSSHTVESVLMRTQFDADEYGPVVMEYWHVGNNKEEFDAWLKECPPETGYLRAIIEAQIADLGLAVKSIRQTFEPVIEDTDIAAKKLGLLIKRGEVSGMVEIMEIETEQGIIFRGEYIGRVYRPGDKDVFELHVKGVPDLHLVSDEFPTGLATCAQVVNRIPDVINATPGYITAEQLPKPKLRAHPLQFYLNR
jgi:4-hydroxy-tetrahydrodipicolinate reductase